MTDEATGSPGKALWHAVDQLTDHDLVWLADQLASIILRSDLDIEIEALPELQEDHSQGHYPEADE